MTDSLNALAQPTTPNPTGDHSPTAVALGSVGSVPSLPIGEDGSRVVPMLRRDGVWQPATAFATARSETIATVLAHIEEGATLTAACDVAGIPVRTWSRWCAGDEALATDYSFSLRIGANSLYWSVLDIARQSREAKTAEEARGFANEIAALEKTAARMDEGRFGESSAKRGSTGASATTTVQQVIIRYDTPKVPRVTDIQSHALGDGSYSVDDDA
jgi:hypothetical protein